MKIIQLYKTIQIIIYIRRRTRHTIKSHTTRPCNNNDTNKIYDLLKALAFPSKNVLSQLLLNYF